MVFIAVFVVAEILFRWTRKWVLRAEVYGLGLSLCSVGGLVGGGFRRGALHARLHCQSFVCHYCGCWRLLCAAVTRFSSPFPRLFLALAAWLCPSWSQSCLLLRVIKNFYRSQRPAHRDKRRPSIRTRPSRPLQLLVFIFIVNVNYSSGGDNCQSQDLFWSRTCQ